MGQSVANDIQVCVSRTHRQTPGSFVEGNDVVPEMSKEWI